LSTPIQAADVLSALVSLKITRNKAPDIRGNLCGKPHSKKKATSSQIAGSKMAGGRRIRGIALQFTSMRDALILTEFS
jgi:hypothetical protein